MSAIQDVIEWTFAKLRASLGDEAVWYQEAPVSADSGVVFKVGSSAPDSIYDHSPIGSEVRMTVFVFARNEGRPSAIRDRVDLVYAALTDTESSPVLSCVQRGEIDMGGVREGVMEQRIAVTWSLYWKP